MTIAPFRHIIASGSIDSLHLVCRTAIRRVITGRGMATVWLSGPLALR